MNRSKRIHPGGRLKVALARATPQHPGKVLPWEAPAEPGVYGNETKKNRVLPGSNGKVLEMNER